MPERTPDHLSDEQLNEFLDGALPAAALDAARLHLDGCGECQARLRAYEVVFASLSELPESPPGTDLAVSVMQAIGRARQAGATRPRRWLRLALAGQSAAALSLVAFAVPIVWASLVEFMSDGWQRVSSQPLADGVATWLRQADPRLVLASVDAWLKHTAALAAGAAPAVPTPEILLPVILLTSVVGLLGNALLLGRRPGARPREHT